MEFENLKNVLGEAYHEGITAEEVNNFFAGKSFADLSTGQYVDKNKYERDIQTLNATITEKQNALNAKLTDDEKRQKPLLMQIRLKSLDFRNYYKKIQLIVIKI